MENFNCKKYEHLLFSFLDCPNQNVSRFIRTNFIKDSNSQDWVFCTPDLAILFLKITTKQKVLTDNTASVHTSLRNGNFSSSLILEDEKVEYINLTECGIDFDEIFKNDMFKLQAENIKNKTIEEFNAWKNDLKNTYNRYDNKDMIYNRKLDSVEINFFNSL